MPMAQAEDSFRATMHVALPDVYEPSAQTLPTLNDMESNYREHSYFPVGETTTVRGFNAGVPTFVPNNNATLVSKDMAQPIAPIEAVSKAVTPKPAKIVNPLSGTKPPRVGVNIEWVQKGVGWDCREVYYVGKKRHRRHLGHIGRQKWEDMQQQFQGTELERVLSEWIEERRAEKSMNLNNAPE